jgi:hypothetical protein
MRIRTIGLIAILFGAGVSIPYAQTPGNTSGTITNEADFRRAMKELSNWGRWGNDDELGAANLITPAKRKQALALAKERVAISLAHDIAQEKAVDAPNVLERVLGNVAPTGTTDRYRYTGTYRRTGFLAAPPARSNRAATARERSGEGGRTVLP